MATSNVQTYTGGQPNIVQAPVYNNGGTPGNPNAGISTQAAPLDPNTPSGHSAAYLAANPQFNQTAGALTANPPTTPGVSPINQPSPSPASTNTTPYTIKQGDTLGAIAKAQGMSVADILKNNPTITDPNKINAGGTLNLGQQSPFKQGFNAATASGAPAPQLGSAPGNTKGLMPETTPDTSAIDLQLAEDKDYQKLLEDRKAFDEVSNQRTSLTEEYKQMVKEAGIPELNTELMNMKNVIEGTEDDIRNEVTKAGGFATDSQVLALSNARNKQLVKNYNNLLDTKQMAMEQVNTMIGLADKDRTYAQNNILQKMQIDEKIMDYRDKMVTNAKSSYQKVIDTVGYDGLYKSTGGDPYYTGLVEKSLGLQSGQLKQLASQPNLDKLVKEANIRQSNASAAKSNADIKAMSAGDAAVTPNVLNGMLNVYKSTGVIPAFGMSAKSPLRAQFYAALGAEGGNQIVSDANMNKTVRAGLQTAFKTQQNQYSANQTAVTTLEKQLGLAKVYRDKVDDSGSPLVNKYTQSLKSGVFGDPDTAALHNIVKTASYEFAKILSGAAASISGATVSSQADAESLLNGAMAKGQFNEVIDLMHQEANFRLNSQKDTITKLQSDMGNVGKITDTLRPIEPSQIPSGYYQASDGLLYKK